MSAYRVRSIYDHPAHGARRDSLLIAGRGRWMASRSVKALCSRSQRGTTRRVPGNTSRNSRTVLYVWIAFAARISSLIGYAT